MPRWEPREQRILSLIDRGDGCWPWLGGKDRHGYGRYDTQRAHRLVYELLVGPIPSGMEIDHVRARGCTRRDCVNPAHLEPVPRKVNVLRGTSFAAKNAAKTHCKRGHEFTHENTLTYHWPSHTQRICRACRRLRTKKGQA